MKSDMSLKGFTLVELLVVVSIIGILITLMLPNTLMAIRHTQSTECRSNLRTINTAAMMCFSERRNWAECNDPGEINAYLPGEVFPTCPFGVNPYVLITDPAGTGATIADPGPHFTDASSEHIEVGAGG